MVGLLSLVVGISTIGLASDLRYPADEQRFATIVRRLGLLSTRYNSFDALTDIEHQSSRGSPIELRANASPSSRKSHSGSETDDIPLLDEVDASKQRTSPDKELSEHENISESHAQSPRPNVSWQEIRSMLLIPSFLVIILQGIVGSTPWNALVFFTLWLQLVGFTDFAAAAVTASFAIGAAFGGLLGGIIGDRLARMSPDHGRILAAQATVFAGIPFTLIVLWGLPRENCSSWSVVMVYTVVVFLFGLTISWAAPACNSPLFAEIVPEHLLSTVYAFDRSFEGALAAW